MFFGTTTVATNIQGRTRINVHLDVEIHLIQYPHIVNVTFGCVIHFVQTVYPDNNLQNGKQGTTRQQWSQGTP